MIQKQGINARVKNVLKKVMSFNVLAEEPGNEPVNNDNTGGAGNEPVQKQPPVVNYEDLIAKARREEKDKLYGQLKAKDAKIDELTGKNNNLMLKVGEQEATIATLQNELTESKNKSSKSDSETVKALEAEKKALQKELDQVKSNLVDPQALEAQIRDEYEVKMYRMEKVSNDSDIIPELVTGNTKEEIDASFELAKTRYAEIASKMQPQTTQTMPKLNTDFSQLSTKSINPTDVSNMSIAEYTEFRKQLGLK